MRQMTFASTAALKALVCLALSSSVWPQTTASSPLQRETTLAMAGRAGSAVVVNVATGKIVAAYNPEVAARRLALPGSAIKPFTLLALLQANKIDGQTALMCKRTLVVDGHKLDCTHPDVKQPLDAATALAYSCNSYFATMALRLTPAELRESFRKDGFDSPSGLAPSDAAGTVSSASTAAELQLQAIGEWGVRVTPLELLRGYQQLAQLSLQRDPKLSPLFDGLAGSVSYGMGHLAQPDAAIKVAGKTGTSLVEEGAWRHGWFAGYAPADHPEIALVVFLEKGHGPTDAATVAQRIFAAHAAARRHATSDGVGH